MIRLKIARKVGPPIIVDCDETQALVLGYLPARQNLNEWTHERTEYAVSLLELEAIEVVEAAAPAPVVTPREFNPWEDVPPQPDPEAEHPTHAPKAKKAAA